MSRCKRHSARSLAQINPLFRIRSLSSSVFRPPRRRHPTKSRLAAISTAPPPFASQGPALSTAAAENLTVRNKSFPQIAPFRPDNRLRPPNRLNFASFAPCPGRARSQSSGSVCSVRSHAVETHPFPHPAGDGAIQFALGKVRWVALKRPIEFQRVVASGLNSSVSTPQLLRKHRPDDHAPLPGIFPWFFLPRGLHTVRRMLTVAITPAAI